MKFNEVLDRLRSGDHEDVVREISAYFHVEISSLVLATAEVDEETARKMAGALLQCLTKTLGHLLPESKVSDPVVACHSDNYDLSARTDEVILREYIVMQLILDCQKENKNGHVGFAEIYEKLSNTVNQGSLIANLARMIKSGAIGKLGKGRYTLTQQSTAYFHQLERQKTVRKIK